jgi:uncharacterized protein YbaA (DUF1428 family)
MSYVDFFVLPLPPNNEEEYKTQIKVFAEVMQDLGMLYYCEAVADDVPHGESTDFYKAVAAQGDETVVVGFGLWPDKQTRDRGWDEGMKDPRLAKLDAHKRLFDGKRMIYGAFKPLFESKSAP